MNKKERQQKEKLERLEKVNQLIQTIATTGRKFFAYKGKVSRMEVDGRGAVWFIDKYNDARIYTHYPGRWTGRGFSEGGTLRDLVIAFRDYIAKNKPIPRNQLFWPKWYSEGDPWDYKEDMQIVRAKAIELGMLAQSEEK